MKNTEKYSLESPYKPNSNEVTNLTRYIREMSHIPRISPEEEKTLGKRIQKGDQKAVNDLVKANLRLVLKIAKNTKIWALIIWIWLVKAIWV